MSLFIGLPASVGLFLVRYDMIAAIYGGGKHGFNTESIGRAAAVLAGLPVVGMAPPAMGLVRMVRS